MNCNMQDNNPTESKQGPYYYLLRYKLPVNEEDLPTSSFFEPGHTETSFGCDVPQGAGYSG